MKLQEFIKIFDERVEYFRRFNLPESVEIYFRCMRNYYNRAMTAKEEGKPLAWVSIMCPMEIFLAMDIVPFAVDPYAISISAFSYFKKEDCIYFDIGDSYGYPADACSPHRACIGLAASNTLPEPDLIYGTAPMPCDSAVAVFDVLSDMKKVPSYFANFEYRYHPKSVQYLKTEFEGLIEFLEKHTGRKLDKERLREIMKISIKANRAMMEVHQLRKKRPCPLRARDGFNSFGMRLAGEGMPETLDFFDGQLREVKGRVERGEGVLAEERLRLVANGPYPFFAMEILDWVQDKYGAIFVADMFNCAPWEDLDENDPGDPVELLARKWLSFFGMELLYGAAENTIDYVIDSVKESQVDGSIFFTHFGCKQTCGLQKIYRDKIMQELGLPTLFVDMDISDPKVVSVDQMKGKIHEYIEMIEKKKVEPVKA
jgi:benzoyl-CoA reductase/2-hydroxyglutaryl-CoA dehydratase subunit BcrC/BadD/HgdB